MRTCSVDDCTKAHRAKGLCATHYNQQMPNRYRMHTVKCAWCGSDAEKYTAGGRYANSYCGGVCRDHARRGNEGASQLPLDHWARWYGATSTWSAPESKPTFQVGRCSDCDTTIVEPARQTPSEYCSPLCTKRTQRRRRRAREHDAPGEFTTASVMRQYRRQGYACAYCKQPAGIPDPEHVVPLSRGGRNDMSNLVAACRACNTDKGDMTPTEWATDRARRGLPELDTTLSGAEYVHLWLREPTGTAWRHQAA
jgi:5-methylcytosine-specific restriction endonuclease McrA